MTTPIYNQIKAIREWTAANRRAQREYELRPFADGHQHHGPNDTPTHTEPNATQKDKP